MPRQSIDILIRQFSRADQIARAALADESTERVALKAAAPDMVAATSAFFAANSQVARLEQTSAKEVAEAMTAQAPLAKLFDEVSPIVMKKVSGVAWVAASSFSTPDDFLKAAEGLEQVVEDHSGEAWAAPILTKLAALVDSAAKEQSKATEAVRALQKAKAARAQAAQAARDELVAFRRVVRATFGRSSREYRDLRDPETRGTTEPPPPA
jgi:hypothetical protein